MQNLDSPQVIEDENSSTMLPLIKEKHYHTQSFSCSYLLERVARLYVVVPAMRLSPLQLGECLRRGFRRNGLFIYRPDCVHCKSCVSVRIPVEQLKHNRSQGRVWKKYQYLQTTVLSREYSEEHFLLYKRYQNARHLNGGMDTDDPDHFSQFILESSVESRLVEFRDQQNILRMVSLMDFTDDGASAVYTYFDPDYKGLGIYSILWQCDWLKQLEATHLYLGYWVSGCSKMHYKQNFRTLEQWSNGKWQVVNG